MSQPPPRAEGHCKYFVFTQENEEKLDPFEIYDIPDDLLQLALDKFKDELQYGDLVEFTALSGYRNQGMAIYDGTSIINLESEWDDYGYIPKRFTLLGDPYYPIDYWSGPLGENTNRDGDMIHHNYIRWAYLYPYKEEIIKNMQFHYLSDYEYAETFITIDTNKIYIMINKDELKTLDEYKNFVEASLKENEVTMVDCKDSDIIIQYLDPSIYTEKNTIYIFN